MMPAPLSLQTLSRFFCAVILLICAFAISACEEEQAPISKRIVGNWTLMDPGGAYLSSELTFQSDGYFSIQDRLRGPGGQIQRRELQGRYSINKKGKLEMTRYGLTGEREPKNMTARVDRDDILHLGFKGGSVAYQRKP